MGEFLDSPSLCSRPAEEPGLCDGTVQLGAQGDRRIRLRRVSSNPCLCLHKLPIKMSVFAADRK